VSNTKHHAQSNSKKPSQSPRSAAKPTSNTVSKGSTAQKRPAPTQRAKQPAKVGCKTDVFTALTLIKPKMKILSKGRGSAKPAKARDETGIWYRARRNRARSQPRAERPLRK
jgi:hypothetical protein